MKKVVLMAVALLMVCAAKAQFSAGDFTWGAKVGLNATNISNFDMKNKASIHVGAFAEWNLSDFIGLSPELVYSRQGARDKEDDVKFKLRVNYLNIPVLFKFYVLEGLSVDAGPQFGFALNSKVKVKDGDSSSKTKVKDVNTFDMSFPIGLSYIYEGLILSARYNIGLTNMWSKDDYGVNTKNHVFQFSLGYRLSDLF